MDMCLTARMMDAREAEQAGLVARVYPADQLLDETLKAAVTIAGFSRAQEVDINRPETWGSVPRNAPGSWRHKPVRPLWSSAMA